MAFVFPDRVKETAPSPGLGDFDVTGAPGGFFTFAERVGNGNQCPYVAQSATQVEWGVATVLVGAGTGGLDLVRRDVVFGGSIGAAKVDFAPGATLDVFVAAPLGRMPGTLAGRRVFTASGPWTRPEGVRLIDVELVGGGGGGAASGTLHDTGGGGGGAGGYSRKIIDVSAIPSETVTIGQGGVRGTGAGGNGSSGGTTSFGAHCSATGGTGGTGSSTPASPNGGSGGDGSGGDLNIGGGAGGSAGAGFGGTGGASYFGGGGRGNVAGQGGNASAYGAGGGGAEAAGVDVVGGDGADGVVIVTEYY